MTETNVTPESTDTSATTPAPHAPATPGGSAPPPRPLPTVPALALPKDPLSYRLKNMLLGPPLHTEQLEHERLGIPTALAVFSSDCISSSAYASEEMLRVLIPVIGVAAFSLVVPITGALLIVLVLLILSYRETIKAYPTAGGAYMVTRDNFGLLPAQVAGVALLTDYVLTVAVSTAAGTAAIASAFPAFQPLILEISIFWVAVIAFLNLRGVKESGKIFAAPTYWFIANMVLMIVVGAVRDLSGTLHQQSMNQTGMLASGTPVSSALFMGASLYVVMHAFASGGAAMTGVEAISNGVTAFRKPEWLNARRTLVIMGATLGTLFFGVSFFASKVHAVPYESGTPTVISQVGKLLFGETVLGHVLFLSLQASTLLILVLAANTSFADFPRLASFHAGDNFMPRQLTKRGHRLVFSNGVIFLAGAAVLLLIATDAKVDRLIPLYAIGVFTSFTLSQAGMARHHLREKEPHWRFGLVVNGLGAVVSLVVDVIIGITKFTHGAWVIIALVPVMVVFLVRLAHQYETEAEQLEHDVPEALSVPVLRRHVVLVFVDTLDLATARALQYARSLAPDDLRAVHFVLDPDRAAGLSESWSRFVGHKIALQLVECPDRRLAAAAVTAAAFELADGQTEVTVLMPDRKYTGLWARILHDRTANELSREVSRLPHTNVTTIPFHFDTEPLPIPTVPPSARKPARTAPATARTPGGTPPAPAPTPPRNADGSTPIGLLQWRVRATVRGRVASVRVQPVADVPTFECVISDGTGSVSAVFFGRRHVSGVVPGAYIRVEGVPAAHHGRLAFLNPDFSVLAANP